MENVFKPPSTLIDSGGIVVGNGRVHDASAAAAAAGAKLSCLRGIAALGAERAVDVNDIPMQQNPASGAAAAAVAARLNKGQGVAAIGEHLPVDRNVADGAELDAAAAAAADSVLGKAKTVGGKRCSAAAAALNSHR